MFVLEGALVQVLGTFSASLVISQSWAECPCLGTVFPQCGCLIDLLSPLLGQGHVAMECLLAQGHALCCPS